MSGERFEFRLGALVVGTDGALGSIDALLAIPGSGQISGFVLSEGRLFNRGVTVPIEAVERTEDSRVHVWLSAAQLNGLAETQARRSTGPPATDERRIEAQQRVIGRDGEIGSLALVLVDPTSDQVTHLVVRRGDVVGRDTIVPMAWVQEVTGNPIVLDASRDRLGSLPEYRPDDEMTDAVLSLLWYRSNTRPDDLRYVRVRTRDGVVHLTGKTRTEQSRMAIEERARSVRGVLGVCNELRTFEALAAAAQALREPRRAPAGHWQDRPEPAPVPAHGLSKGIGSAQDAPARRDGAATPSRPEVGVTRPLQAVA
jgi:hypothetical protein